MKAIRYFVTFILLFSLVGCTAVDKYYILDKNDLGYLLATKNRDADNLTVNRSTDIALTVLDIISAALSNGRNYSSSGEMVYDVSQQIFAVLVTSKSKTNKGFNVRANFARIVCNNQGTCRYEQIPDEDIYQEFFDKLGQSLFLTGYDI